MTSANARRWLEDAARRAGLGSGDSRLRLHDLRHTFASHLIIDVELDVVQVSRMLGHASANTTLDIYAHTFDYARRGADLHRRMTASAFLSLLDEATGTAERGINVIPFPSRTTRRRAIPQADALFETRRHRQESSRSSFA